MSALGYLPRRLTRRRCPISSQALPGVIRTNSYCGLESASEFTKCEVFVGCFEYSTNFHDWASCMEHAVRVHGSLLLYHF